MNTENLGNNIRLLCAYYKIKTIQLSLALNLSENRVNDIITGKNIRITEEEVAAIAGYFNIPIVSLLHKKAYLEFK